MRRKNFIIVFLMSAFLLGVSLWNAIAETPEYSESERRLLAKFPQITLESVMNGEFAKDFEEYSVERFPVRDVWRRMKAYTRTVLFAQKDNHDIYTAEGHISKLEYPMNTDMADYALKLLSKVNEKYLHDNKIYFSIVPDKNRYLADENGYLSIDYQAFSEYMKEGMDFAKYIEIADLLKQSDYYYTDTHWRQEALLDVAERIATTMGTDISQKYSKVILEKPFNGVYLGQSALAHEPDVITYLDSEILRRVKVEGANAVYDMEKANGRDPYEMFLSGNQPIVTIRDEENSSGKRLIMFRDSFGSSIAPLFTAGYSEIVLVDLRYIGSDMLGQYVDFRGADILFIYSTLLLNNSLAMK